MALKTVQDLKVGERFSFPLSVGETAQYVLTHKALVAGAWELVAKVGGSNHKHLRCGAQEKVYVYSLADYNHKGDYFEDYVVPEEE